MNPRVTIERMAYSSDAIGYLPSGKTVFVEGGAPGDVAQVEIIQEKKTFARAKIAQLLQASPDRVAPKSPADALCGTAPWQHLSYNAQLQAKRQNITGALEHTAHLSPEQAQELTAPVAGSRREWNYRNKLELGAGTDAQGHFILGFYGEGTDELHQVDSTQLAHKAIAKAPKALQGAIRYAQGSRDLGIYRVGVRHSLATGEAEIALWTPPGAFPRAVFAKTLADTVKATGIIRVMAEPGKARKIKGVEVLDGRGRWTERLGEFSYATQAPSFFQVNSAQAERLVATVLEGLGDIDGAYIADLYAGGGTFSIPLAAAGADVVAVEAAASSVRDLRNNAQANDVFVDVVGGDAAREIQELGDLDALVVDPPRAGLAPEIIGSIAQAAPRTFVYVSCDPATWARDVARLSEHGYELVRVQPVDMFPQTFHVEVVSFFAPAS